MAETPEELKYSLTELEALLPQLYGRMRLPPAMEKSFRHDYYHSAHRGRFYLQLVPLVLFGLAPLYGRGLFGTPEILLPLVRALELWVIVPVMALAAIFTLIRALQPLSDAATLGAGMVLVIAMTTISALGETAGWRFPAYLGPVYLTAMFVIARLPFRRLLVCATLTMLAVISEQVWLLGNHFAMRFEIYGQISVFAIGAFGGYLLELNHRTAWLRLRMLETTSRTDPLTGIFNRRGFDEALDLAFRLALRQRKALSVLLFDVDYFKALNDRYGHEYGDSCLQTIGHFLRQFARRPLDLVARYGGEEFVLVLYDCTHENAQKKCADLLREIDLLNIENFGSAVSRNLSISIGAVVVDPQQGLTPAEILRKADKALYAAKANGRNRYEFAEAVS